jgi:hypothetical protein
MNASTATTIRAGIIQPSFTTLSTLTTLSISDGRHRALPRSVGEREIVDEITLADPVRPTSDHA